MSADYMPGMFRERNIYKGIFSSVAQLCPTLCDPRNRNMPGLPVDHQLPEFTQTHVHRVSDAIQPSHPLSSPSPPVPSPPPVSGSFPMSQFFASGGQSIGVSASTSILPMNIQGWFPLGWTGLISLVSRDSHESSPGPQFESINSSALSLFMVQLLHLYMTTGKTIVLIRRTSVRKKVRLWYCWKARRLCPEVGLWGLRCLGW